MYKIKICFMVKKKKKDKTVNCSYGVVKQARGKDVKHIHF